MRIGQDAIITNNNAWAGHGMDTGTLLGRAKIWVIMGSGNFYNTVLDGVVAGDSYLRK